MSENNTMFETPSMPTVPATPKKTRTKPQGFTKFQTAVLMLIAFFGIILCIGVIAFGPNDTSSDDRAAIIEQIRQEKLDYIQMRTTGEEGKITTAILTKEKLAEVKKTVEDAEDPSQIDIDAEVNRLMGL